MLTNNTNNMFSKSPVKIEDIVEKFFKKMTLPVQVKQQEQQDNVLKISLVSPEAQILIGQQGRTLDDVQCVLARIIRKHLAQEIFLDIDINGYKKDKEQRFRDLANEAADEVSSSGKEKMLFPMTAFERRIIHTELMKRNDVKTESIGENENRRVVVMPA